MRTRRVGAVVSALILASSTNGLAGQSATTWIAGGGLSLPVGDFNIYANDGPGLLAGIERSIGRHPTALRLDLSYGVNSDNTAIGFHETTRLYSVLGSVVYHFTGSRPHLYALAGVGYFHRRFTSNDPDETPINDSHVAIQVGEGAIVQVGSFKLFVEGRFVSSVGTGPFRFAPLIIGLRLGGD